MALACHMTYVASQKRWTKWYRGTTYSVSCKQLGTPATKEQSRVAANLWWEKKQAEIDAAELAKEETPEKLAERRVESVLSRLDDEDLFDAEERGDLAKMLAKIRGWAADSEQAPKVIGWEQDVGMISGMVESFQGAAAPAGRSIAEQVEAWLTVLQISVRQGMIHAGRYESYKRQIGMFRDWFGAEKAVEGITAAKLEEWWAYLAVQVSEQKYAIPYAKGIFMTTKQFITRLAEIDLIDLPRNIRSRRLQFKESSAAIERLTVEEVKVLLAGCDYSERTKLYLLLCLNCGMYQNDIAELVLLCDFDIGGSCGSG